MLYEVLLSSVILVVIPCFLTFFPLWFHADVLLILVYKSIPAKMGLSAHYTVEADH
jgi:uncharacterized membrane protein